MDNLFVNPQLVHSNILYAEWFRLDSLIVKQTNFTNNKLSSANIPKLIRSCKDRGKEFLKPGASESLF